MLYLTFHLNKPVVANIKSWQQQTNHEVLRWQLAQRGRANVVRLRELREEQVIETLPAPGEAEPAYGPAGAFVFTFSPEPGNCRVTVANLCAGDEAIYGGAIEPLALNLDHCLHVEEDPNRLEDAFRWRNPQYRGALPPGGAEVGVEEVAFWIDGHLMRQLETAGWTLETAGDYEYSFRPHGGRSDVWVTHRQSGAKIQLVADSPIV
jgi:hypothetical protein